MSPLEQAAQLGRAGVMPDEGELGPFLAEACGLGVPNVTSTADLGALGQHIEEVNALLEAYFQGSQ